MYLYQGCRDPIQKITGDAYRRVHQIPSQHVSKEFLKKISLNRIDYEWVDEMIKKEIHHTSISKLSRRLGISRWSLFDRLKYLGFVYDRKQRQWIRKDGI